MFLHCERYSDAICAFYAILDYSRDAESQETEEEKDGLYFSLHFFCYCYFEM